MLLTYVLALAGVSEPASNSRGREHIRPGPALQAGHLGKLLCSQAHNPRPLEEAVILTRVLVPADVSELTGNSRGVDRECARPALTL